MNVEREAGRVFNGWNEGKIYFAPTYKYSHNSDSYAGETTKSKKKRRTPAWYSSFFSLFFFLLFKVKVQIYPPSFTLGPSIPLLENCLEFDLSFNKHPTQIGWES